MGRSDEYYKVRAGDHMRGVWYTRIANERRRK